MNRPKSSRSRPRMSNTRPPNVTDGTGSRVKESAEPRIVGCDVDTIYLSTTAIVAEVLVQLYKQLKSAAKSDAREGPLPSLEIAGHRFTVQPFGAKGAPYVLDGGELVLKINPHAVEPFPTAIVEVHSLPLWKLGADAAIALAEAVLAAALWPEGSGTPLAVRAQISRIDLAADVQGVEPTPEDRTRFVTRAGCVDMHTVRGQFTGLSFGRGEIHARLYDKTAENRSEWQDLVSRRLESVGAVRRRRARVASRISVASPGAPQAAPKGRLGARRHVGGAAPEPSHALEASLHRLAFDAPPSDEQDAQAAVPLVGEVTARGFAAPLWDGSDADLFRLAREESLKRTTGQLAGLLVREMAHEQLAHGGPLPLGKQTKRALRRAARHSLRKGRTLAERAEDLAESLRAREGSLARARFQSLRARKVGNATPTESASGEGTPPNASADAAPESASGDEPPSNATARGGVDATNARKQTPPDATVASRAETHDEETRR